MYKVKLEKFEGPLDLLLELIEKEKLEITEISLAQIADQYLSYLTAVKEINPTTLADFLVVAAQLLLIKSKALLPDMEVTEEEKITTEELTWRLKEYKKFKDIAQQLKQMEKHGWISFEQRFFKKADGFYPGDNLALEKLYTCFKKLTEMVDERQKLEEQAIKEVVSIEEKIDLVKHLLFDEGNVRFQVLVERSKDKGEIVVTFLALLELIKQKFIKVNQDNHFGEIYIQKYE